MRIRLKRGKQRELILKAKQGKTWQEISKELKVSKDYLRIDLYNENRLLDSKLFAKLSKIASLNFSRYIKDRLEDNWGRSIGGKKSSGRTKKITKPKESEELAELVGIILGDGSLYWNEKRGVYALKIAGDLKTEKEYLTNFIKSLMDKIFKINSKIEIRKSEIFVSEYSKEIIKILEEYGLKRGNKKINNIGIPEWIKNNKKFLEACIRGLIDTDGSIFRMSRKDPTLLRISFKNRTLKLLTDARNSLITLGFSPSRAILNEQFFISRKEDIHRYITYIKFNNPKHVARLLDIAPWCSGQIL